MLQSLDERSTGAIQGLEAHHSIWLADAQSSARTPAVSSCTSNGVGDQQWEVPLA